MDTLDLVKVCVDLHNSEKLILHMGISLTNHNFSMGFRKEFNENAFVIMPYPHGRNYSKDAKEFEVLGIVEGENIPLSRITFSHNSNMAKQVITELDKRTEAIFGLIREWLKKENTAIKLYVVIDVDNEALGIGWIAVR